MLIIDIHTFLRYAQLDGGRKARTFVCPYFPFVISHRRRKDENWTALHRLLTTDVLVLHQQKEIIADEFASFLFTRVLDL